MGLKERNFVKEIKPSNLATRLAFLGVYIYNHDRFPKITNFQLDFVRVELVSQSNRLLKE